MTAYRGSHLRRRSCCLYDISVTHRKRCCMLWADAGVNASTIVLTVEDTADSDQRHCLGDVYRVIHAASLS